MRCRRGLLRSHRRCRGERQLSPSLPRKKEIFFPQFFFFSIRLFFFPTEAVGLCPGALRGVARGCTVPRAWRSPRYRRGDCLFRTPPLFAVTCGLRWPQCSRLKSGWGREWQRRDGTHQVAGRRLQVPPGTRHLQKSSVWTESGGIRCQNARGCHKIGPIWPRVVQRASG